MPEEKETIQVCGKYCSECVYAQFGGSYGDKYYTSCDALATQVENTDNPLDQCPYCVRAWE